MTFIKLMVAPIRRVVHFPLFQLLAAIAVILFLEASDTYSAFGRIYSGLDLLVDGTVRLFGSIFATKSFTRSWLTAGFMIAYVYVAGMVIILLIKTTIRQMIEFVARSNVLGLTNAIARERGIEAYRAWLPLERIRPPDIPQDKWEERFAWPADGRPPYPPLAHRMTRAVITYLALGLIIAALLQAFTPIPALTWLGEKVRITLPSY